MRFFVPAIALACALLGIALTLCGAYYGSRAAQHRNPSAPHRWLVCLNRWQAGWFPDQLDQIGLEHRRTAFRFQLGAVVCYVILATAVWWSAL